MSRTAQSRPSPRRVVAAAATAVVAAGVAGAFTGEAGATWRSTVILDVDQPLVVAAAKDPAVLDKLSRLRFRYAGLVGTYRVARLVAQDVGRDVGDVRPRLVATALPTDLLLRLAATGGSADEAQRTAAALATVLVAYVEQEQRDDGVPADQRVELEVVDAAGDAEREPARARAALVAVLVGSAAAAGVLRVRRTGPAPG